MAKIRSTGRFGLGTLAAAAAVTAAAQVEPVKTVHVECERGASIARALTLGDERLPLVVVVHGVCAESVTIARGDVTVRGAAPGDGITGPDAGVDVVSVKGDRVTLEGLSLGGGRNGIAADGAAGLVVRGVSVSGTGRSGLSLMSGTSARIEGSLATRNRRDGVALDAASAILLDTEVSLNGRIGVAVVNGASARIGIDATNATGGCRILSNGGSGIAAGLGGSFYMAMTEVSGNGTDPTTTAGRNGVNLVAASATLIGGNTVAGNASTGVVGYRNASFTIGDPTFGFGTVNTISGNGTADGGGGVFAFQGSSAMVRNAVVTGNRGYGVAFNLRSAGQLSGSTIEGNSGDGVLMAMGGAVFVNSPPSRVSGNGRFGVSCQDGETSLVNQGLLTLSDNVAGSVAPGCTGF